MANPVSHIAWECTDEVLIKDFLNARPTNNICMLANHAIMSSDQLSMAVRKAKNNFANGLNRARELDTEFIRILAGTHNISLAFKRVGLKPSCRKGWLVNLGDDEQNLHDLATHLGLNPKKQDYVLSAANLHKIGIEFSENVEPSKYEDMLLGHVAGSDLDY